MVVRFPREHNAKLKQLHAETEPKGRPAGRRPRENCELGGRPRRTRHAVVMGICTCTFAHKGEVLTYLFPLCAIAAEAAATSLFKGSFGDFRVCSPGHDGAITAMPSVLAASRIRSS